MHENGTKLSFAPFDREFFSLKYPKYLKAKGAAREDLGGNSLPSEASGFPSSEEILGPHQKKLSKMTYENPSFKSF